MTTKFCTSQSEICKDSVVPSPSDGVIVNRTDSLNKNVVMGVLSSLCITKSQGKGASKNTRWILITEGHMRQRLEPSLHCGTAKVLNKYLKMQLTVFSMHND